MNIALFGGSFDPPHLGHEHIVCEAVQCKEINRVYISPAYISPFKSQYIASVEDRLIMVQYMAESLKRSMNHVEIIVLEFEMQRRQKSYTWRTIAELARKHPQDNLYVLIGGDQALEQWKNWEYIIERAEILVFPRSSYKTEPKYSNKIHYLSRPHIDISSQEIRQLIVNGDSFCAKLNEEVFEYIKKHSLYELQ